MKAIVSAPIRTNQPRLHANPLEERRRLARSLPQGPIMDIMPGLSNSISDDYTNNQSYLPVLNYMSVRTGAVITPVYEGDLDRLRASIQSRRYPLVHASVLLFDDLRQAGYTPLAMNEPGVGAAFVVRANSRIRKIEQIAGHSLALDDVGAMSFTAAAALRAEGLQDLVRIVGGSGPVLAQVLDRVVDGTVDAGVLSTSQVAAIERDHPGMIRVLATYPAGATDGVWAAPHALTGAQAEQLVEALTQMGTTASDSDASASLSYATGLPVHFKDSRRNAR